jgi:hypothetical protein
MENQETDNTGAWFNKNNWQDMKLIFDPNEPPPEGFVRVQPLHSAAYQVFDEETGKWKADPNSEKLEKIAAYKAELAVIDQEAGAGRAVRGLALRAAEKAGIESEDMDRLTEMENRARELRAEIAELMEA